MKKNLMRLFTLLLLIFVACSVPFLSYDPTNADAAATATPLKQSEDRYVWFHKVTAASPAQVYKMTVFDRADASKKKTVTYTPINANTVKSISGGLNCGLFLDSVASPKTLSAYKFEPATPTATLVNELIGSSLITASDVTKNFLVGDLCAGLKIDASVYHFTAGTGYQIDTVPAWVNPVFSNDFSYVAAADGVYKYDSVGKSYSKVQTSTYQLNKKIWKGTNRLLVFSWADSTVPSQTNIKDYKVEAFSVSGNTLTQAALIQGKSYDSNSNVGPFISVSQTLQTIVVYGQNTSTTNFARGKIINYATNTASDFSLPELFVATSSYITVSDVFVYARNKVNKAGTNDKFHGGYQIFGQTLARYFEIILQAPEVTAWTRSFIADSPSKQLLVYREHVAAGVIRIEQQVNSIETQIFKWDKTNAAANTITGAGASFSPATQIPAWFLESTVTGGKQFISAYPSASSPSQIIVTLERPATDSLKVVSGNKRCAAIYDSVAPTLKVYNFLKLSTSTILAATGRLIASSLYTGVDVTTLPAAEWQLSDDCNAIRIGSKVMHWDNNASNYVLDTFPVGSTITNPIFTSMFTHVVTDGAIYHWTKPQGAAGTYVLDRSQTFNPLRSVWRSMNNLLIFTYKETSAGSGKYDWKVQPNTIVNNSLAAFGEFTGQSTDVPQITVSMKLSKVIVYGKRFDNATQPFYAGKSIEYDRKAVKNLELPLEVTGAGNEVINSDDFLYAKNKDGEMKHFGYVIMGTKLVQQFNETFPLPLTVDYARSFILPDPVNKKLVVAQQLNPNNWIRVIKSERKSPTDMIVNQNQAPPYEMTFTTNPTGTLQRQMPPRFGKWVYTTETGTKLNYVEYDPTVPTTKKKTFQAAHTTSGNNLLLEMSPDADCALTAVSGSAFDVVQIYPANNTVNIINAYTAVSADFNTAAISTAITQKKVRAGPGCWAFRLGGLIYLKNNAGNAFAKLGTSASAGFANAVYDNSLKFALAGNTVYKFVNNDYASAFTVENISAIREIFVSADQNKVLIMSFDSLTVPAGTPGRISGSARLFAYNGSAWNPVPLNFGFNNVLQSNPPYTVSFSPNFETIGFAFINSTASRTMKPFVAFFQVNDTTNTVTPYDLPPEFLENQISQRFSIYGTYLYYLKFVTQDNFYVQYYYKFNPGTKKIDSVGRNNVDAPMAQNLAGGLLNDQNGTLFATFEVLRAAGAINVERRLIGSSNLQNTIRGIETLDSGVVIVDNKVMLCPPGCAVCNNPTSCSSCQNGFVLDSNNFCIKCAGNCKTCTTTDLDVCLSCFNGFYLSTGTCLRCNQTCLTCSSPAATDCSACKVGFFINSTDAPGSCAPCIENCVKCSKALSASDPLCEVCKMGSVYHPNLKKCVKCIAGCMNCKFDRIHQCDKCGDGFEPIMKNGTLAECRPCPRNCKVCENRSCSDCRQGFRPLNGTCIEQCKLPCQECLETNSSKCTSCIGGFLLDGEICKPDFSCNQTANCSNCPIGFNLISGNCFQCNGGDNCRTCDNDNIEKCSSCIKGFYLTPTATCTPCTAEGCGNCRDEFYCLQCKPGFTLSGSSEASQCIKCHASCATCFEEPANCDKCADGFTKRGWKCVTTNNVGFNLRLNTDFDGVSTEQFMGIQQQVCTLINKTDDQVNLEEMKSGSVIISGTIDANNQAEQASLVNALSIALISGGSLGGFSIESSSFISQDFDAVTPASSDENEKTKKRDVAIILGVVIPGVTLIVLVILFVLYKKGILCKRGQEVMDVGHQSSNINMNPGNPYQNQKQMSQVIVIT